MLSYGKIMMIAGTVALIWYIWGYAIGQRDERRKWLKRK